MTFPGPTALEGSCIVPGCPHRTGRGHFMCKPCYQMIPEDKLADMRAAITAAAIAVAELRKVTT